MLLFKKSVFVFSILVFISWVSVKDALDSGVRSEFVLEEDEALIAKRQIVWHWENRFNRNEVQKVKKWLTSVFNHSQNTLGDYPFNIHFYIHRSSNGKEPVPWAHTSRGEIQGVHFHINPDFTLEEFLADWTAPHEISHLSIPFVGPENMWFSEGYATFMQVQVLHNQGVYTDKGLQEKFGSKFMSCQFSYQSNSSVIEVVDSLKKEWNYPHMYWGGASFFWKLNRDLENNEGVSLLDIIQKYQQSCRVNDSTPKEICAVLDSISGTNNASKLLIQYQTEPAYLVFEEFSSYAKVTDDE